MCTALTLQTAQGNTFFGRTMDFSYVLEPEIYVIPKGYSWNNLLNTHTIRNHYSVMGIGQDIHPVTLADGVNEMGFAAAALYFPGYAAYDAIIPQDTSHIAIAALELVNFLLAQCSCVAQAASLLRVIRIVGLTDPVTDTVAPLHWLIADKSGRAMTIEKTADGLGLMENNVGVLSNSPDFKWHMTNLRNYMNVFPWQNPEVDWGTIALTPFGQGAGTQGLPGDYTPPGRFVRTAWLKSHTPLPAETSAAINTCFHLLDSVTIPKWSVITQRAVPDYTQYTAFMDLSHQRYYFKTYDNCAIATVELPRRNGTQIHSLGKLNRPITFESL